MNGMRRKVAACFDSVLRLWYSACVSSMHYRSVLFAVPLCTSVCFFMLRFVLSTIGVSV